MSTTRIESITCSLQSWEDNCYMVSPPPLSQELLLTLRACDANRKSKSTKESQSLHSHVFSDNTTPGTTLDKEEVEPLRFLFSTRGKGTEGLEHLLCARDFGGDGALCSSALQVNDTGHRGRS